MQAGTATVTAATLPATAAADHDERGPYARLRLASAGIQGRIDSTIQRYLTDRPHASQAAQAAEDAFNPNSDEWVAWVNEHAAIPGDISTITLEFAPNPPNEASRRFLVTERDPDGTFRSAEIDNTTVSGIDETVRLESIAAENAASEIETAYEKFVKPNDPPSEKHLAYLGGKYRFGTEHVTSTLLGDDLETSDQ